MNRTIIVGLLMLSLLTIHSKAQNVDSLLNVWNDKNLSDSIRVVAYNKMIWNGFLFSDPDSAFKLTEALQSFGEEKKYKEALREVNFLRGSVFYVKGDYPLSLEYYQKALKYDEELQDKDAMAASMVNIGLITREQGNQDEALRYLQSALQILEEIGNKNVMTGCLTNIGVIYFDRYDYDSALQYFNRSIKLNEEIDNQHGIAEGLHNIGSVYERQKKYPEALELYLRASEIQKTIGDLQGLAFSYNSIGVANISQQKFKDAIPYCDKGLKLAEELKTLPEQKIACSCLFDSYKGIGDFRNALDYYQKMVILRDSMFNEENTQKITRLEMQYEFDKVQASQKAEQEKKDAIANEKLQRQRMVRNGFIGGFAIVLLFAVVFFFQRNRIGKEKARSENLLLNILPVEVADELKAKGEAEARLIDQATVLFTDFKGFTSLSEKLSPKEIVHDLNVCFSEFDRICQEFGIEKIKTIGDAYMAAGGLPAPNQTHAMDVIKAALKMRDFIDAEKEKHQLQGKSYFDIRIGIHTGPVVAGIVGVKKFQYDIWGDTVNTASRMESSGEPGKVNISGVTYSLVKDHSDLVFESRGMVHAKGKGDLEMYFVS